MSSPVEFIPFAKKVAMDFFALFFFSVTKDIVLIEILKYKNRSPCSFNRKRAFISLSSLA